MRLNNFLKIGAIEACSRILSWLTPLTLAFILSAEQYGLITILIALENIFLAIYVAGLDKAVLKFGGDFDLRVDLIKKCLIIWCIQVIIVSLISIPMYRLAINNNWIESLFINDYQAVALLIGIAFVALNRIHNAQMRVFNDNKGYLFSRFIAQLFRITFIVALIVFTGMATSYIYGTLIFAIIVIYQSLKNIKKKKEKSIKKIEIIKFSWPYIPHVLSGSFMAYSDKIILQNYASLDQVGSYGFAYLIGSSITFIYGVMASYFEPYFYKDTDQHNIITPISYIVVQVFFGLAAGSFIILLVYLLGFDEKYSNFIVISPIVLVAYLFHPIYLSGNYALAKNKRTGVIASGSFLAAAVTIALNLLLIPEMGVTGAALATVFGFGCLSLYIGTLSGIINIKSRSGHTALLIWILTGCIAGSIISLNISLIGSFSLLLSVICLSTIYDQFKFYKENKVVL